MISAIAIDDEPLALQLVENYIKKTPFVELSGAFDNPFDAMSFLEKETVDLIFLDIQMPDLTGLEFARVIKGNSKIIFTTAFEQYALESFRLEAIDYLLKPFSYEEFLKAVQRVNKLVELEKGAAVNSSKDYMFLKSDYKIKRINFNDILYIEGLKDYIKVYLVDEQNPILSLNSLKSLEDTLPKNQFMRVHRSFIINLDKITTVDRSRIVFAKTYVPIGDQYKEKFQEFLDKKLL